MVQVQVMQELRHLKSKAPVENEHVPWEGIILKFEKYISSSNHQASVDIYVFKEWLVSSTTQQWQMKV